MEGRTPQNGDADEGMVGVGDTIVSIFPLILRKGVEIGERA
jgi:hypothetical protein